MWLKKDRAKLLSNSHVSSLYFGGNRDIYWYYTSLDMNGKNIKVTIERTERVYHSKASREGKGRKEEEEEKGEGRRKKKMMMKGPFRDIDCKKILQNKTKPKEQASFFFLLLFLSLFSNRQGLKIYLSLAFPRCGHNSLWSW